MQLWGHPHFNLHLLGQLSAQNEDAKHDNKLHILVKLNPNLRFNLWGWEVLKHILTLIKYKKQSINLVGSMALQPTESTENVTGH